MEELFNVYVIYPDQTNECVGRGLTAEQAVLMAHDYSKRPAAMIGVIKEIMITDSGDCCVFQWQYGKGVAWPVVHDKETSDDAKA